MQLAVLSPPQTAAGAEICAPRMAECSSLPGAEVSLKDEWVSGQQTPNRCYKSIAFICRVVTEFGQDHWCFVLWCLWTCSHTLVTCDTTLASLIRSFLFTDSRRVQ